LDKSDFLIFFQNKNSYPPLLSRRSML